ncbi:efflux transporter outer membrane subunit [Paenalcaligenes sp. Me52]|uniref:efflux transporter outer membrane subunit n=1 Tax=Paenalcaligenes sp. Me52 TaxID=3392038 RepID=UPI003D26B7DF
MKTVYVMLGALWLAGCAALPADETEKTVSLPSAWQSTQVSEAKNNELLSAAWWQSFQSPELLSLLQQVQTQNWDLEAAAARIRQAEAQAQSAGAALWPDVKVELSTSREGRLGGDANYAGGRFGAGLRAAYEVDLWGGVRAGSDAATSRLVRQRALWQATQLRVSTEAAKAWVDVLSLNERLQIAQQNQAVAYELLQWMTHRSEAGAEDKLAVVRQQQLWAEQRQQVERLTQQQHQAQSRLQIWTGTLGASETTVASRLEQVPVPTVESGVPSQLLVRRPDLLAAEAELQAAKADVLVARAAMLPQLNLSLYAGGSAGSLSDVLRNPLYNAAANLLAPIFNAGRLEAGYTLAQAKQQELLMLYQQSIVQAFVEVEVALEAVAGLAKQEAVQQEIVQLASEAMRLAQQRYEAGAETAQSVLETQRQWYQARDVVIQHKAARLWAVMDLYRALGGGWPVA